MHMKKEGFGYKVKKYRILLLMLLPAVLYTLLFAYLPMVGALMAFKDYNYADGIFHSPWCGQQNFKFFFSSGQALKITLNTLGYNLLFIVVGTALQVTVAILLSELKNVRFKKTAQSLMFLPYFISWVIVSVIAYNLLSYDSGMVNSLLSSWGMEKISFYEDASFWPAILVFFSVWKGIGYGSVMYLAAIMGIDTSMYEAAEIDGANVFQRIFKITLPCLLPTLITLLLLALGGIFRGNFDMFYNLIGTNGILYNATDVIDTFTFRALISSNDFGMASASGLYQSVFCFLTVVTVNKLVKKYNDSYALF